jgi:hypothetical protein
VRLRRNVFRPWEGGLSHEVKANTDCRMRDEQTPSRSENHWWVRISPRILSTANELGVRFTARPCQRIATSTSIFGAMGFAVKVLGNLCTSVSVLV